MNPQHMYNPPSLRSIRTRFAYRFLRALKKLNKQRTASKSMMFKKTTSKRYHMVKMAAYSSMASAVGSRRAWSRAFLRKMRNRGLRCRMSKPRKNMVRENPNKESIVCLRKLVPGGEEMDLLSLFDETAHYVKCLTSQVQIMRNIVEIYSNPNATS